MTEPLPVFPKRLAEAAQLDALPSWQKADGRPRVLAIGEVLWDLFPDGPRLGGAPANFACHAAALGSAARLISRVGDDPFGHQAIETLCERGVDTTLISTDPARATGTVAVVPGSEGDAGYRFAPDTAWDHLSVSDAARAAMREADAVCFGTLAQRSSTSRKAIGELLKLAPADTLRLCDLNLREPFIDMQVVVESLQLANALKLNEDELVRISEWFELTGDPVDRLRELQQRFRLDLMIWTRGPKGSVLLLGDTMDSLPGAEMSAVNSVGAGDSFAATVVTGMLQGVGLSDLNQRAAEVASYVCSQTGAVPKLPDHLLELNR